MASEWFTPFQSSVVSVKYQDEVHDFNITRFTRFFDEPWTANAFWDAQPLAFILYADKNKLSSFGTQKGYPIIARIANLPVEIQNGVGMAGGRVMGWLPIINEDQKDSGKASFVNFKNAVWHKSFLQLIESVIQHSNTGYWFDCGDLIRRLLWPIILILSADYEEQCIMALIHGLKGKFPCPVCLVPQDMQSIHTEELALCTSAGSQQVLKTARLAKTKKTRETHLQAFLLRDVEVEGQLFRLIQIGFEFSFDAFLRWPHLKHFSRVMKIDLTDNATHEDISKEYITKLKPEIGKNWNFPKKHSNVHVFDNILAKGILQKNARLHLTKPFSH
ncbi:hypothetical protein F4604DRAFT_1691463 [Suillus subluteus]|nr:hypothetical protein F4604DRAFT_1691463 [Suillus subluteus]